MVGVTVSESFLVMFVSIIALHLAGNSSSVYRSHHSTGEIPDVLLREVVIVSVAGCLSGCTTSCVRGLMACVRCAAVDSRILE